MKDPRINLHDISRFAGEIFTFAEGADFASLATDGPWPQIVGARNFLAHGYDRIDPGTLWKVIETDLAPLLGAVDKTLARLAEPE